MSYKAACTNGQESPYLALDDHHGLAAGEESRVAGGLPLVAAAKAPLQPGVRLARVQAKVACTQAGAACTRSLSTCAAWDTGQWCLPAVPLCRPDGTS